MISFRDQTLILESHAVLEHFAIVESSARNYRSYSPYVRDILDWIPVHEDEIGALARFDGPDFALQVHGLCRNDGGSTDGHRRESGSYVVRARGTRYVREPLDRCQ